MAKQPAKIRFGRTVYFRSILFFMAVVLMFVFALFAIYNLSKQYLETDFIANANSFAVQIGGNINATLESMERENLSAGNLMDTFGPTLNQMNDSIAQEHDVSQAYVALTNSMDNYLALADKINYIGLIDETGNLYIQKNPRYKLYGNFTQTARQAFEKSKAILEETMGKPVWLAGEKGTVLFLRAIFNSTTLNFCGYLVAELSADSIAGVFASIDEQRTGNFVLYDPLGNAIFNTSDLTPEELALFTGGEPDSRYYSQFYPLQESPLRLLYFIDLAQRNQRYFSIFQLSIALLLLSIVVTSVFFRLTYFKTARSVEQLLSQMKQISKGRFDFLPIHSDQDEIAIIADGLGNMSGKIEQLLQQVALEQQERERSEYELLLAQYHVLQTQVNPHFLYNALESIQGVALLNDDLKVSEMICRLAAFFRSNLAPVGQFSTFEEECTYLRNYVKLYQDIYPDRLEVVWDIDPDCAKIPILSFLLQPIIENSLVHGMESKTGMFHLTVSAKTEGDRLVIVIQDDGSGISPSRLKQLQSGKGEATKRVGLHNIQKRLQLVYGGAAKLLIESEYRRCTKITLRLPKQPCSLFLHSTGQE